MRRHHVKLADALLSAITYADYLDTVITVEERGKPVLIIRRDTPPNAGVTVEFIEPKAPTP